MSDRKNYYSIGKVSTLCNVPIKTLRYYDNIGLLVPDYRDSDSNYRYYTQDQILTLFIIRKLKHLGIPLKEISQIVSQRNADAMGVYIRERLLEISKMIEDLNNQYSEGQLLLDRLEKGHNILETEQPNWSTEGIRVEEIPTENVLFTRSIKRNYKNNDVSVDRWFELFEMVSQHKLRMVGPIILTYHNNPLDQFFKTDCDLEICIQINEARDDLPEFKRFGNFKAVTALHIGRNDEIIQTHIKAIKWLNQQGYTIAGPISEEYIISPVDINNEENHITKVIIP
ncbi:MAG: MerR family transcriptional regulator, partial [Anaerotignum sp.]